MEFNLNNGSYLQLEEGTIFRFSMAFQNSVFYLKLPTKPLICGDYSFQI